MTDEEKLKALMLALDQAETALRWSKKIVKELQSEPRLDLNEAPKSRRINHPLPEDWTVPAEAREWAARKFPRVNIDEEGEKFCAYWRASGGRKLDWGQAFRTWIYRANEFGPSQARPAGHAAGSKGRAAAISEGNRAKADSALDKLSEIRERRDRGD